MSSHLLIVESPSKAKTLKKYLGSDFEVLASYGHVRDLVPKQGAVDTGADFAMKYQPIERNAKHVDAIAKAVKKAGHIYLATDPDREGEAIAWHLMELLREKKLLGSKANPKDFKRVVFYEITESAVQAAVAEPREISMELVNAQQARRALDYLVGFNLSPLLWKKIRRGLSAGRVQSPALRLIVEREKEIAAFVAQEYWTTHFDSHKEAQKFSARLTEFDGEKIEQFTIGNADESERILSVLRDATQARAAKIDKKRKMRSAAAPFTTSTLQQEAVRKLGFSTDRTMKVAQQLYEGVDTGQGAVGLITYMRTDSVTLANDALTEIRAYIESNFDSGYLPAKPNTYRNKSKNAQEAHEAVRPTAIARTPQSIKESLSADQYRLYEMIWKRTLASQMSPAQFDTVSVDFDVAEGRGRFRANGQVLTFPGFIAVYREDVEDSADEDETARLPALEVGESVPIDKLYGEQHFTQPPPRYSEASLVKTLEEFGIGRPSTYASIISTLIAREYVSLDKKRFIPTDVGKIVAKFLTEHFEKYVDYDFTAQLEDQLDEISTGKTEWLPVLADFWTGFKQQIEEKQSVDRKDITHEALDEACPKCSKPLGIRLGKRGRFVGCSGYPDCDYTRSLDGEAEKEPPITLEGRTCPKCDSALVVKHGPYGKFIGCSSYPKCKFIEPLEQPKDSGVTCPQCNEGSLIQRKSRYGKIFYSCNTYPKCNYATWNPPIAEKCPNCGWPVMTLKTTKRRGEEKVCPQKECAYSEPVIPTETVV